MKKIIALLLALSMLVSLSACGVLKEDPNVGMYLGVSCEVMGTTMTMQEVYPGENYLDLKPAGIALLVLEGDKIFGTWSVDGETLKLKVEGEECPGTLKNGVAVFDLAGAGVILTFAKEGATVPNGGATVPNGGTDAPDAAAGPLGVYQGTEYEYSGQKLQLSDVYSGQCMLELLEDNKAVLTLGDQKMDCTWTLEGEAFTLDNVAAKSTGTLKDGTVTINFMNMGMMMTFVMGGSSTAPEGGTEAAAVLEPGYYPLYAVDDDGEYTGNEIITMAGLAQGNYIFVNDDGTLDMVMDGEKYICTYDESSIIDDEGGAVSYAVVDGLIELYLEGNLTFYYQKSDSNEIPAVTVPAAVGGAFPADAAEDFYGDWHGWCVVTYGTGDYEDEVDYEFEMLARYVFDENGNCTPWMSIYSEPEDNFQNVSLSYDESDQFVYLSGQLFEMEILPESYMYESFGSLSMTLYLQSEYGTLDIVVCLRHPDGEWDAYDYPCMPEDAQAYYSGMSFEERVAAYGLDPADLPALS